MIRPEQVPNEVADALWQAICDKPGIEPKKAIAAALSAWPGKDIVGYGPPFYGIDLILPLPPQEASDE